MKGTKIITLALGSFALFAIPIHAHAARLEEEKAKALGVQRSNKPFRKKRQTNERSVGFFGWDFSKGLKSIF
jgi:hypothetical protein